MIDLKLNKQLLAGIDEIGIKELNDAQQKLIPRILGGSSFYLSGKNCTEKENALCIGLLQRLNYSMPDAPRTIIMVANSEQAVYLHKLYTDFAKKTDLIIRIAHEDGHIDDQNITIYEGADLVVATPKRLNKLYFQNSININKVQSFVLYDAELILKERFHVDLTRFTESLPKFQSIIYCTKVDDRLKKTCGKFTFGASDFEF